MKINIVYLLLITLLGIIVSASIVQQNQNVPKTDTEVEALKIQRQTVENEKMEIETKLAEANAKLMNADFGKFERELRDTNDEWLRTWSTWFLAIIAIIVTFFCAVGAGIWARFKSKMDQLIADRVEESLNGFKEAVVQLDEIKNQLKVLHKGHAVSVLDRLDRFELYYDQSSRKQTDVLSDDVLLEVFNDESKRLGHRYKAAKVLSDRKFPNLVSLLLEFVNSVVDVDRGVVDVDRGMDMKSIARDFVYLIGESYTQDAFQGLKEFLNRLLTEDPECKDLFLTYTAFALADISIKLELSNSISILKKTIPELKNTHQEPNSLSRLAKYFDMFNEPDSIKEILTRHVTSKMRAVETNCLNWLEKYDADFVKEWKEKKETTNTESEES